MGQSEEARPVVIVRGLAPVAAAPTGVATLLRDPAQDLFR
jgi:F420-0:gamma-glutamyl ligase